MAIRNLRKPNSTRPRRSYGREATDLLGGRGDGAALVDASYGDTLRGLLPRRLSAFSRRTARASG